MIASVLAPSFLDMGERVHPWRRLRALAGWTLHWHTPENDPDPGFTLHDERIISLRTDLTWPERRSTVLHECLHAERGPVLEGVLTEREELAVRRAAARILLPSVKAIGEALAWARCNDEAADELMVDVGTLNDRLRWLHPAERHYLTRRLEEIG